MLCDALLSDGDSTVYSLVVICQEHHAVDITEHFRSWVLEVWTVECRYSKPKHP